MVALGLATGLTTASATPNPARRRQLRVAHLTDVHVSPDQAARAGFAAALRHVQGQADRPDLVLFGGDCIGDALDVPKAHVLEQWQVWDDVLKAELKTPAKMCLGNHDILGWKRRWDETLRGDPHYGKTLGLERLGLAARYYSFDQAGWHFVVLDSMEFSAANNQGYVARLDDEQFAWLEADLAASAGRPVCVLSHIPILSVAAFFDGDLAGTGTWVVPGAWMHIDARRIQNLFEKHPHVKVCLSGHLHMIDDVTYRGVRHLCGGAVCGGWWKGEWQGFGPTYAMLDLYDDGSVERTMVPFRAG